jgi:hypothetical protein
MNTVTDLRGDVTRGSNVQFLDLICADDELVQAEFDAIIAAEWPSPPPDRPRRHNPGSRHPGRRGQHPAPSGPDGDGLPLRPRHPGVAAWSRPRSPPTPTEQARPKAGDAH